MMILTKEGFATTPGWKSDYMSASLDSKRARGDWLFPLALQKCKNVDTHTNKKKRKEETRAPNENDCKVDFIL